MKAEMEYSWEMNCIVTVKKMPNASLNLLSLPYMMLNLAGLASQTLVAW